MFYHDVNFLDRMAPIGYGRCKRCGQIISRDLWAGQVCPGPRREEEK